MSEKLDALIKNVDTAFEELRKGCQYFDHRFPDSVDCNHPDQDYKHILCNPANCPLLS